MVKRSPENRSFERWQTSLNPLPIPRNLARTERDLWKAIVASKSPDWFDAASGRLLLRYVRTAILAEKLHDLLSSEDLSGPRAADLLKKVVACNGSLGSLAARLRLSTQVSISARSTGKMAERAALQHHLIGGAAVHARGNGAGRQ